MKMYNKCGMEHDQLFVLLIFYVCLAICACVGTIQIVIRIVICLTPWVESCHNTCCFIYQIEKERMKRRTVIHPLIIYNVPTAEVSYEDTNVCPASIVSTAAVEVV